jgi:hypothetical protein
MESIFTDEGRELLRFLWHKEEERFLRAATSALRAHCRNQGVPEAEFMAWVQPHAQAAYHASNTVEDFFGRMIDQTDAFVLRYRRENGQTDFEIVPV